MGHADLYDEAAEATRLGLNKAGSVARRGLDQLGEGVNEVRNAVVPVTRDVGSRVAQASNRTVGYVRDEPVRSAIVAAAVGTLAFALWHLLSSRNSR